YNLPSKDQKDRIDYFEKVIFDKTGTTALKMGTAADAMPNAGAAAWASAAVGSGVGAAAADAHSKKELDDKIRDAQNKASADYTGKSADLAKECEEKAKKV